MKTINVTMTDDEIQRLHDVKGDRTWREAILQEFNAND